MLSQFTDGSRYGKSDSPLNDISCCTAMYRIPQRVQPALSRSINTLSLSIPLSVYLACFWSSQFSNYVTGGEINVPQWLDDAGSHGCSGTGLSLCVGSVY